MADTTEAPVEEAGANGAKPKNGGVFGSFDDILATDDRQYEVVPVPEWGRPVRLVSLDGHGRNRVSSAMRKDKGISEAERALELQCRVVVESMVDEDGLQIGSQSQALSLMGKNNAAIVRLFLVCARLSGVGSDEAQEALEGLKATPSADTGSD